MISRRGFLRRCGWIGAGTLLASARVLAECGVRKPNIVFILVDDLGWADLGCYGSAFYRTPCIDALAASGMRFTDAYTSCPVCSPTRASIMTGQYPARLGITDWIPGEDPQNRPLLGPSDRHRLPLEEFTIAEALRHVGYRTFYAGKWHLGGEKFLPEDQGFGTNLGGCEAGSPPAGYYSPYKNPKLPDGPPGEYLTDRLTDEAIRFIHGNPDGPFFLFLAHYAVHTPIQACRRHVDHFRKTAASLPPMESEPHVPEHAGWTKRRQDDPEYASMIRSVDENVGRLLETIDALKLRDETVVVFTSDNGGLSTHARRVAPTSNLPLRAGKGWCYEGGIRVPLIVRAPRLTRPGSTCAVPVTSTDFYPTVLELSGLSPMPFQHRDGISLVPLFRGRKSLSRKALYWHYPHYHGSAWTPGAAVRAGGWKLIEFYDPPKVELYHLKDDVGERRDLSRIRTGKTAELLELLHRWQTDVGAIMPRPNPEFGR
jgi:arylsulfatase A-like enzyme